MASHKQVLASLFDPKRTRRFKPPFPDEIAAVASGRKPISYQPGSVGELDESSSRRAIVKNALDRGLSIFIVPQDRRGLPRELHPIRIWTLRSQEAWRVQAIETLWTAMDETRQWSEAGETQMSMLLGYSKQQREAWRKHLHELHVSRGATIYGFLDQPRRKMVLELGKRSLGPASSTIGLTLFARRGFDYMKPNAARKVPKGFTLVRFGLGFDGFRRLFKDRGQAAISSTEVTARNAQTLADGLVTKVELLGARGWV